MSLEPQWERHVGNVSATLNLFCLEKHPDELTEVLGIEPTSKSFARLGASLDIQVRNIDGTHNPN